ncbi:ribokinase [Rhodococcus kronopolitis]|uniref:Ribokinase n=1 Tax=Rhodococcus kronopolitis TaxID=1460226 RepID=A0ABV9FPI7_9NOCA
MAADVASAPGLATDTRAARIAVLGSINMDLAAATDRLPRPGETVLGHSLHTGPGGKGANQAVAAARAGATVTFLGAVGDDVFALQLRQHLVDAEVDARLLRETSGPSGVALITVAADGENSIVATPGANATMTELDAGELDAVAAADLLLCQLELPLSTVLAGARHAHDNAVTVVLNPSPARPLPDPLLDCVDVLVVNETEAGQLGAATLRRVPHLVTTVGARGASYRGPDGAAVQESPPTVRVLDSTGAGDALTGELAASWHRGPEVALRRAVTAGALATTRRGADTAPTRAQVDAALDRP